MNCDIRQYFKFFSYILILIKFFAIFELLILWCDNLIAWPIQWVFEGGLLYGIIPHVYGMSLSKMCFG